MKLIISPAKKMNRDTDNAPNRNLRVYVDRARELMNYIRSLDCARVRFMSGKRRQFSSASRSLQFHMVLHRAQSSDRI